MADVDKIKDTNGNSYNLKDSQARSDISSLNSSKVPNGRQVAGVNLADDITAEELRNALNVANGSQVNVIEVLQVGDVIVPISSKTVQITKSQVISLLGAADDSNNGYLSKEDHQKLTTLYNLLTNDQQSYVDTLTEVMNIFRNYPEATNLITQLNALSNRFVVNGDTLEVNNL